MSRIFHLEGTVASEWAACSSPRGRVGGEVRPTRSPASGAILRYWNPVPPSVRRLTCSI
jgi:hypothetical protein